MEISNFEKVRMFHTLVGHPVKAKAQLPDEERLKFRLKLISNELEELNLGITSKSLGDVADALADLLYVIYRMGHELGIQLDAVFEEVHRSNMSKTSKNGVVMKGKDYFPPTLEKILDNENLSYRSSFPSNQE
ncbi:MAG: nucleoside triphosphate pyrophosphohydrolase family protein [Planctomycetota bacterium]